MIDLDELIAEAREATACGCADAPEIECGTHGDDHSKMVGALADALESVRAERDAALEVMSNHKCGENVEAAYRRAVDAEARIAEAAKLHRPRKHWKSDREHVFVCDECTRINRYGIAQWPCPTAVALGLNEGEVASDE